MLKIMSVYNPDILDVPPLTLEMIWIYRSFMEKGKMYVLCANGEKIIDNNTISLFNMEDKVACGGVEVIVSESVIGENGGGDNSDKEISDTDASSLYMLTYPLLFFCRFGKASVGRYSYVILRSYSRGSVMEFSTDNDVVS
jgi:hypothetical protein